MTHRPPSEIARLSPYERAAWRYWIQKVDGERNSEWWERMGRHLGTLWFKQDFGSKPDDAPKAPRDPDRAFYPLSVLISPNSIYKQIKNDFSNRTSRVEGYVPEAGEEVVEVGDLDAAEYKAFMQRIREGLGST